MEVGRYSSMAIMEIPLWVHADTYTGICMELIAHCSGQSQAGKASWLWSRHDEVFLHHELWSKITTQ